MTPTDTRKSTDSIRLLRPRELAKKGQTQIEQLTEQLEDRKGIAAKPTSTAEQMNITPEGPVAHDDWMKMEAERFKPETIAALEQEGLTRDSVLSNPDKAELYVRQVFIHEGIPDGNGGTEQVKKDVVQGHFDQSKHGIDLIAADTEGKPVLIEVKKYNQTSAAQLSDYSVVKLEPEVERWQAAQEDLVTAKQEDTLTEFRPDARETWKPEVAHWQQGIAQNEIRIRESEKGKLPVQQMDDLWTRDRWLKLIKTPEGCKRLQDIGIDEKYLNYRRLRTSPDLPEWQSMLDQRVTVIVSGGQGDTGKRLFLQAVAERRSKRVVKIEV